MPEILKKSLAQIVHVNYRAAAVFEKYHLDFCCKGKRTLLQACEETGLNAMEVISQLELESQYTSSKATIDYTGLSLSQLADYIISHHHQYTKKELPSIAVCLQKIIAKHGGRHPEMLKVYQVFMSLKEEMELHMQKEEAILFPRIKEMESQLAIGNPFKVHVSYLQSPVSMMEQEHDHAGTAMATIRELTSNYTLPEDACTTYKLSFAALAAFELDLHQHVHLENNMLFPMTLAQFKKMEQQQMN